MSNPKFRLIDKVMNKSDERALCGSCFLDLDAQCYSSCHNEGSCHDGCCGSVAGWCIDANGDYKGYRCSW